MKIKIRHKGAYRTGSTSNPQKTTSQWISSIELEDVKQALSWKTSHIQYFADKWKYQRN